MSIPFEVNRRIARARKKETNCAIFTDVISMVCTLIEDYSLPISVRESLSNGKKELTGGFKPIKKVALIAGAKRWRGGGRGRGRKARKGKMEESAYPLSPIPLPRSIPSNPWLLSMPTTQAIKKVEIFWMNSTSCCKAENGVKYYSVSKNI